MIFLITAELVIAITLVTTLVLKRSRKQQHNNAQMLENYAEWLKSQPPQRQESQWHPDPETIKRLRAKYRHLIDPDAKPELALTPMDVERIINLD